MQKVWIKYADLSEKNNHSRETIPLGDTSYRELILICKTFGEEMFEDNGRDYLL
jgi:hypothetical protein